MLYRFGAGALIATPNSGDLALNPTPLQFGTLQEVSLEINFDNKELYGRNQFPDDVARAKGKITGKAKFARMNGKTVNDLFFGQTLNVGQITQALDEAGAVPTTPFQITVSHGANFVEDLGVRYASTGEPLKLRVGNTGTPVAGEYTYVLATGVYTFAAAETGINVLISYMWNNAAVGNNVIVKNQLMGFGPRFSIILSQQYGGDQSNVKLYSCIATKMSRPTKQDDYTIPEFDFSAFADASGNVIQFSDKQ